MIRRLLGLCSHKFSRWGPPERDMRKERFEVGNEATDGTVTWIPETFQRRTCEKCGLIQQRTIGPTVLADPE